MGSDLYKGRADSANRLRSAIKSDKSEGAIADFVVKNFKAIMESDLPEDEKEFLAEICEIKGGDLEDEIGEYEMAYHGLEGDDILGLAEKYDGELNG